MTKTIRKVAVIGAGAMGAAIAAQAANAGLEVVLLDNRPTAAADAVERMAKAKPTDIFNAGFMHASNAKLITTGNTDEHMNLIADADMVIEAVYEKLEVKHAVFQSIYEHAKKDAIITSNTSTIREEQLTEGFPEDFKNRFVNTHFFNPPRFMHLMELITGKETDPVIADAVADFCDRSLGKKVIRCKDTPGFIGNRIGMYMIERARTEALRQNANIEDVDAIMGESFGFPRLGLFKLADEVGIDIVYHVGQNLHNDLPENDDFQSIYGDPADLEKMIADGYTGKRKGKGGFYRESVLENGAKVKESRDLATGEFRPFKESKYFKKTVWRPYGSPAAFLDSDESGAKFAWPVLRDTLLYALNKAEDMAYDIQSVDSAMRAGYNWKNGPFQMIDQLGVDWFTKKLELDGITAPDLLTKAGGKPFYQKQDGKLTVMDFAGNRVPIKREEGVLNLDDIKTASKPLLTNNSASLWDIGDGVVCAEFHSKGNSIDSSIFKLLNDSINLVNDSNGRYKAMVVYNDGDKFSVGANLGLLAPFMEAASGQYPAKKFLAPLLKKSNIPENWKQPILDFLAPIVDKAIEGMASFSLRKLVHELVWQGQATYAALNQAPFPVIVAPKGQGGNLALGGGMEILLNADGVQSGPEQNMDLPEVMLDLLPAWGGAKEMLLRAFKKVANTIKGPMPAVADAAMTLGAPILSWATSAQDAKKKGWMRKSDGISMNPDRVLADAKAKALGMVDGYKPEPLPTFNLPGPGGANALRMKIDSMYLENQDPAKGVNHIDIMAFDRLSTVLTGGEKLTREEVRLHTANPKHFEALEAIIDGRPEGEKYIAINPTITLNSNRMWQLERQHFMDAVMDEKHTWPRILYTLKNNSYLREPRPNPAPEPNAQRALMPHAPIPLRDVTGQPISGDDMKKLDAMSDMTRAFYEAQNTKFAKKETIAAVKAVARALIKL